MGNPLNPYFAIQVAPKAERQVTELLLAKGYEPLLPLYKEKRQWADRIKTIETPLFPGYLFCRLDISNRLPVLTTPGVKRLVGAGKQPLPIGDHEIEAVKAIAASGVKAEPWRRVTVGQHIRLMAGPLKGAEGTLIQHKKEYRLVVSIDILDRAVATEIDLQWIAPAA